MHNFVHSRSPNSVSPSSINRSSCSWRWYGRIYNNYAWLIQMLKYMHNIVHTRSPNSVFLWQWRRRWHSITRRSCRCHYQLFFSGVPGYNNCCRLPYRRRRSRVKKWLGEQLEKCKKKSAKPWPWSTNPQRPTIQCEYFIASTNKPIVVSSPWDYLIYQSVGRRSI